MPIRAGKLQLGRLRACPNLLIGGSLEVDRVYGPYGHHGILDAESPPGYNNDCKSNQHMDKHKNI